MIFLETDRLLFRSHELQDEVDFVQMHTDPEVRRYVGGSAWPREKALHRFRNAYLNQPSEIYGLWATIFKENEKYIGCCGIANPPNGPGPSLGYYIARQYWDRGLASEASQAFITMAFRDLRLPRIFAHVEKGHGVSEHILQKFGFKIVSEEKYPTGRVISLHELLRKDWEKQRA